MKHFAYLRNACGSTNEHDIVNVADLHLRVLQSLLDRFESLKKQFLVQGLKLCSGQCFRKRFTLVEILDIDGSADKVSSSTR